LTGRDVAKTEAVAEKIRAATGNPDIEVMELHLESPASVRAFAKEFLSRHPALHILLANAGVMACPLARTPEGWEMQFATNPLGHFLLPGLVAPAPRRARLRDPPRHDRDGARAPHDARRPAHARGARAPARCQREDFLQGDSAGRGHAALRGDGTRAPGPRRPLPRGLPGLGRRALPGRRGLRGLRARPGGRRAALEALGGDARRALRLSPATP